MAILMQSYVDYLKNPVNTDNQAHKLQRLAEKLTIFKAIFPIRKYRWNLILSINIGMLKLSWCCWRRHYRNFNMRIVFNLRWPLKQSLCLCCTIHSTIYICDWRHVLKKCCFFDNKNRVFGWPLRSIFMYPRIEHVSWLTFDFLNFSPSVLSLLFTIDIIYIAKTFFVHDVTIQ